MTSGNQDGNRQMATFDGLRGLVWTSQSQLLGCARNSHNIRLITDLDVSTYAGKGVKGFLDGLKELALFNSPTDLVEHQGHIYVTDTQNNRVRAINMLTGTVTSIGSGAASSAPGAFSFGSLHLPLGIDVLPELNELVVTCRGSQSVMRADLSSQMIHNFSLPASDGKPAFKEVYGIACAPNGDVYVCDEMNHQVRLVMADGTVVSVIGSSRGRVDGPISSAKTANPLFLAFNQEGDLFWTEGTSSLRRVKQFADINDFDISCLLSAPGFSDSHIIHTASHSEIDMHMGINMALLRDNTVVAKVSETLTNSSFPVESIRKFMSVIYGDSHPLACLKIDQNRKERARLAGHLLALARFASLEAYIPWLESQFTREVYRLVEADVAQLAMTLHADHPESSILSDIIMRVARAKFVPPGTVSSDHSREAFKAALATTTGTNQETFAKSLLDSIYSHLSVDSPPNVLHSGAPSSLANEAVALLAKSTFSWLKSSLPEEASATVPLTGANLTLVIENGLEVKVHDWLLWARWQYIRRLWASGMAEVSARHIVFPSDFPPTVLQCILELLYGLPLLSHTQLTEQCCQYVLENGAQFDLANLEDSQPLPIFRSLFLYCEAKVATKEAPPPKYLNEKTLKA
jgi:hypothetical protein